jgi:hypothetical protein
MAVDKVTQSPYKEGTHTVLIHAHSGGHSFFHWACPPSRFHMTSGLFKWETSRDFHRKCQSKKRGHLLSLFLYLFIANECARVQRHFQEDILTGPFRNSAIRPPQKGNHQAVSIKLSASICCIAWYRRVKSSSAFMSTLLLHIVTLALAVKR